MGTHLVHKVRLQNGLTINAQLNRLTINPHLHLKFMKMKANATWQLYGLLTIVSKNRICEEIVED